MSTKTESKSADSSVFSIWAVNQGDDDRSSGHPEWIFTDEVKANAVARGRGWYGGDAPVSSHLGVIVDGKCYLLRKSGPVSLNVSPEDEIAARERAIAKLNDEDKKVLGIR